MATKSQVLAHAKALNCTLLDDGNEIEAFAPTGFVFAATDTMSTLVVHNNPPYTRLTKSEAWGIILDDLASGLRPADPDDHDAMMGFGPIKTPKGSVLCLGTDHTII